MWFREALLVFKYARAAADNFLNGSLVIKCHSEKMWLSTINQIEIMFTKYKANLQASECLLPQLITDTEVKDGSSQ